MHETSKVLSYASWHQARFSTKVCTLISSAEGQSCQVLKKIAYATFLNCYSSLILILNNKIAMQEIKSKLFPVRPRPLNLLGVSFLVPSTAKRENDNGNSRN